MTSTIPVQMQMQMFIISLSSSVTCKGQQLDFKKWKDPDYQAIHTFTRAIILMDKWKNTNQ